LLLLCERAVGRERFDRFVRDYIEHFRFTSITTEEFMAFLEEKLPGTAQKVGADEWLHQPGLPKTAPVVRAPRLEAVLTLAAEFPSGKRPDAAQIKDWTPSELTIYLQRLPRQLDGEACAWLDKNLALTGRGNHEILVEWLTIAVASDYEPVFAKVREVLTRVGRMKYLRPLYTAMGRHPRTRTLAAEIYAAAKPAYHSLSRRVIEGVIAKYDR
jgi:hypothetical protein